MKKRQRGRMMSRYVALASGFCAFLATAQGSRADFYSRIANEESPESSTIVITALLPIAGEAHHIWSMCRAHTKPGDLDRWMNSSGEIHAEQDLNLLQCCQTFRQTDVSKATAIFVEELEPFVAPSVSKEVSSKILFKIAKKIAEKATEKALDEVPQRVVAQANHDWGQTVGICAGSMRRYGYAR